ncbi:unnamed protein product [Triticum turgidum subsp. durum]|uniref:Uncharacterized protein n=1 Tax=Triticum turgidum subsp. durum TaxID=4567 RepID=A0A9R1P9W3_TRITD|nr:unnamed protein product [Triticum turgidum subsp. durum]
MPLLGAFVADSWLGRYRSIIVACTLYVLGYGMMTLVTTLQAQQSSPAGDIHSSSRPSSLQVALFYASLYLIPLAQGADKPCGLAFAADQFDADHPKERVSRSSLFNWWYFSMAIGISIAVAVVSYIQENVGWGIGFGMLCAIMFCAFAVFLSGTPTYRLYAPIPGAESPFARLGRSLEFFYDQMPRELRSLGLALYFSVMGVGGFISSALISFIDPPMPTTTTTRGFSTE